jgi:hypothetical protein
MSPDTFRELINEKTASELLDLCLHDEIAPYVFDPAPAAWDVFRDDLGAQLGVDRADVRVVGSGRLGFSMKPGQNLRLFRDTSDIDVVIVDADAFDELWLALLDAAYPRPPITNRIGGWLERRRNELYTGWLSPLDITIDPRIFGAKAQPVLDFTTRWFNAFKEASQHPPRRHEDLQARLYRTWRHAELYHVDSLAALRRSLMR